MRYPKLIFTLFSLFTYLLGTSQRVNFTIHGKIANKSTSYSVLMLGDSTIEVPLINNNFSYTGSLAAEKLTLIRTSNSTVWSIWIAAGDIDVTLEEYYEKGMDTTGKKALKIVSVTGPLETEKCQWFYEQYNGLNKQFSSLPPAQKRDAVLANFYPLLEEYITAHPASPLSAPLINYYPITAEQKSKLEALLSKK